jgi:hypothetical protein
MLAELMNTNFNVRRRIFGDSALGELNIKMVMEVRAAGGAHLESNVYMINSIAQSRPHNEYIH